MAYARDRALHASRDGARVVRGAQAGGVAPGRGRRQRGARRAGSGAGGRPRGDQAGAPARSGSRPRARAHDQSRRGGIRRRRLGVGGRRRALDPLRPHVLRRARHRARASAARGRARAVGGRRRADGRARAGARASSPTCCAWGARTGCTRSRRPSASSSRALPGRAGARPIACGARSGTPRWESSPARSGRTRRSGRRSSAQRWSASACGRRTSRRRSSRVTATPRC